MKQLSTFKSHLTFATITYSITIVVLVLFISYDISLLIIIGSWGLIVLGATQILFISKVRKISYDQTHFYIQMKDMEIIIPLEETKGIGIQTVDGIFELELINPSQAGKKILFKPSLLYPLTYKKVDKEIAAINSRIKRLQKQKKIDIYGNYLQSFN